MCTYSKIHLLFTRNSNLNEHPVFYLATLNLSSIMETWVVSSLLLLQTVYQLMLLYISFCSCVSISIGEISQRHIIRSMIKICNFVLPNFLLLGLHQFIHSLAMYESVFPEVGQKSVSSNFGIFAILIVGKCE